jgi:hypothetical protein
MVITVQLGMGEALTIVRLLLVMLGVLGVLGVLRVWREHALRVGLLVRLLRLLRLLRPLVMRVLLKLSIRWRRSRPNAGQQGLEIVGGGHFCRAPWMTGDLRTKPKLRKLSDSSLSRGRKE